MIRAATPHDVKSITDLHLLILPDSIFVRLGRCFLQQYYHTMLITREHVFLYVWEHEGRVIGFISMASSLKSFYRQIYRDAIQVGAVLIFSALRNPQVLREIIKALQFLRYKDTRIPCQAHAELLQLAVHPEYRAKTQNGASTNFFLKNKVRVAEELFGKAVQELDARGVKDFRIMTGDANIASNRFYSKMGSRKVAEGVNIFQSPTSFYKGDVKEILDIYYRTRV
jgi:ribosomal protein S18 acetylase RimI-like enzyme